MRTLSIDIETYSGTDLTKSGVYRYVEDPDFDILLLASAFNDDPVEVIDLTERTIPESLITALFDPFVVKTAYNAAFEITCLNRWFRTHWHVTRKLLVNQWEDTMILAAAVGLPRSLGEVAKVLKLGDEAQKDTAGKNLIKYFSMPCKPTKTNGQRTRNLPEHAPDKWERYIEYNRQDVVVERAIRNALLRYRPDETEYDAWVLDQQINARGVMVDMQLVEQAIAMSDAHKEACTAEAIRLTGLANPNSVAQLKEWLEVESLTKLDVADMLKVSEGDRKRVLELRQELGKSSVKKYEAIRNSVCEDNRVRGLFQFYGANRTGRWAGRLVQLQNLPQNHITDLDGAREVLASGDALAMETLYGSVPDNLSQLLRTVLVAPEGCTFAVADFAAIEARVIAWLAGEQWRQDVFRNGGDIYCASASQMFHVPVEKHGVNGHLRQKGKVAELALGYGGSTGAMINMGALRMGLTEDELPDIVTKWREASPNIVKLWRDVENAAMLAVKYGEDTELHHGIRIFRSGKLMHIKLPSGRCIRYYAPHLTMNKFGRESIGYQAYDNGKWGQAETFGGKLTENIVQAIARDCLRDAMLAVSKVYPDIVMHIHDEMVVEIPSERRDGALKEICSIMGAPIPWAPGLLLRADGYTTDYYKKD